MKRIVSVLVFTALASGLFARPHGNDTLGARHFLGLGYTFSYLNQSGDYWLTYQYAMKQKLVHGVSVDYRIMKRWAGFHALLRLENYSFVYTERDDPRSPSHTYYSWSENTTNQLGRLCFDPTVTFNSRGDEIRFIGEIGFEVSQAIYGHSSWTRTAHDVVVDTSGNYHTVVSTTSGTSSIYDQGRNMQFLLRVGFFGTISDQIHYSLTVRPRFGEGTNYIPISSGFMISTNFTLYWRVRKLA